MLVGAALADPRSARAGMGSAMAFAKSRPQVYDEGRAPGHLRRRRRQRRGRRRAARGGRVPPDAREVPGPRRPDPQGGPARRPAGHGQDAAGQGGRRRGGRAVLLALGLRLRRDVRRRRRGAGPQPVRAGRGQGPLPDLHRRARRPGQGPRRRAGRAATTSATRPSTSSSSRWTGSTPTAGSS